MTALMKLFDLMQWMRLKYRIRCHDVLLGIYRFQMF